MIRFETFIVGDLQTNCYIVWDDETKKGVVIDPGEDGQGISEEIQNKQIEIVGILMTHGHFDHSLATLDLKLIYNVPIYLSKKDDFLLKRQDETAKYFLGIKNTPPNIVKIDIDIKDGEKINFGNESLEIIETPGHTPGSVCFYSAKNNLLFSGDTLFKNDRGRTDFSYGSKEDILKSLKRLVKLPKETEVLPGHGETTTIEDEYFKYGLS